MQIRERFSHLRAVFVGPIAKVIVGLYALLGAVTFIRDNLLPPEVRLGWDTFALIPHWSGQTWAILGLAVAVVVVFEGSFRKDQARTALIATLDAKPSTRYDVLCRVYDALTRLLTEFNTQGDKERCEFLYERAQQWYEESMLAMNAHLLAHEKIRLRELFFTESGWKRTKTVINSIGELGQIESSRTEDLISGGDFSNSRSTLHGLKNEIGAMIGRSAPQS